MHQKKTAFVVCLLIYLAAFAQKQPGPLQYVQPLTGTAASTTRAALMHGQGTELLANTIPAVTLPFAMTQWTAQTRTTEQKCLAPYYYKDELISGFRGTHWLSGSCTQDYGSVTLMPITGRLATMPQQYQTAFAHQQETASPAYYRVQLPAYHIVAEMSATRRCGMLEFTVDTNDSLYLLITPNSDYGEGFIRVSKPAGEISGYNPVHRIYQGWGEPAGFSGYFVVQVQTAFSTSGVFSGGNIFTADSIGGKKDIGAYVGIKANKGMVVRVKVGTSFSSMEGARKNLKAEMPGWNFNAIRTAAESAWQKALRQIRVEGAEKNKRIFYTAMYHAMQHPRLFNDADGTYPAFASHYKLMKTSGSNYYDDFSMWDIYRAQLPLLEILQPRLMSDCVNALLLKSEQGGWLPNFPCWNSYTSAMIGDHGTAFIASAFVKGIRGFPVTKAYRAMRKNAFDIPGERDYKDGRGRRSLASYLKYGYYPLEDTIPDAFHKKEQVSRTLEYAYDDYCLAQMAKRLHLQADYALLTRRGNNWKHVFDTARGFVNGRYANGSWYKYVDADRKEALVNDGIRFITEGTPRQYTFYVPQDVNGLARLMGGTNRLEQALDSIFLKKEYWHGNEPGHHIPFLYNYTHAPYKAQQQVRNILQEEYEDGPGGLSGNDDAGQMSAWYVFAALGFYPVDPASDEYALVSPLFDKATILLPSGKTFVVVTKKQRTSSACIRSIMLNGKATGSYFLKHAALMKGGVMEIHLTDLPGTR